MYQAESEACFKTSYNSLAPNSHWDQLNVQYNTSTQSFLLTRNPRQPAPRRRSKHGTASLIAAKRDLHGQILLAALQRHEFYDVRSELILGTCALPRHVYTKVNHAEDDPLARVRSLIDL